MFLSELLKPNYLCAEARDISNMLKECDFYKVLSAMELLCSPYKIPVFATLQTP